MKVAVLTATKRYGGLDVTLEGLLRQSVKPYLWIVADELWDERRFEFEEQTKYLEIDTIHMCPRVKPEGYYSDLPAIYNAMARVALEEGCDIAVSLQDYVVPPTFGLEKFTEAIEATGGLISGICSMARYPSVESVAEPEGLWSIFRVPWHLSSNMGLSSDLEWPDVRGSMYRDDGPQLAEPDHWEMNWAAFPLDICRKGVWFDEQYGEHIGNENQQFAWAAHLKCDRQIYVDPTNHAISLPHRHYFPEEWEGQQAHRAENVKLHSATYGSIKRLRQGGYR